QLAEGDLDLADLVAETLDDGRPERFAEGTAGVDDPLDGGNNRRGGLRDEVRTRAGDALQRRGDLLEYADTGGLELGLEPFDRPAEAFGLRTRDLRRATAATDRSGHVVERLGTGIGQRVGDREALVPERGRGSGGEVRAGQSPLCLGQLVGDRPQPDELALLVEGLDAEFFQRLLRLRRRRRQ